jgi:hypothetical protein
MNLAFFFIGKTLPNQSKLAQSSKPERSPVQEVNKNFNFCLFLFLDKLKLNGEEKIKKSA